MPFGRWMEQVKFWNYLTSTVVLRKRPAAHPLSAWRPLLEPLEERLAPAIAIWDGGGTTSNWSEAANWLDNVTPVAGDDLLFGIQGAAKSTATNDFAPATVFRSLTFDSIGTQTGYTLNGNPIALTHGITDTAPLDNTIDFNLRVDSAQTITVGHGAGRLVINGIVSSLGTFDLTKNGLGKLILTNANTYAGQTLISVGSLLAQNNTALGEVGAGNQTVVSSGASLELAGGITVAELLNLNGTGITDQSAGALRSVQGNNTLTGTVTLGSASHVGVNLDKLTISGQVTGAFALTKVGKANLVLANNANDYGSMNLNEGNLGLGGDSSCVFCAQSGAA